jgi:hypothetical protein
LQLTRSRGGGSAERRGKMRSVKYTGYFNGFIREYAMQQVDTMLR